MMDEIELNGEEEGHLDVGQEENQEQDQGINSPAAKVGNDASPPLSESPATNAQESGTSGVETNVKTSSTESNQESVDPDSKEGETREEDANGTDQDTVLATNEEDVQSKPMSPASEDAEETEGTSPLNETLEMQLERKIAYLDELEQKNFELLSESADQKRVIEMLRVELTRKDEELLKIETETKLEKTKLDEELRKCREESNKKVAEFKKAYELANRDKESMVIKYAMGEKEILLARKGKEVAEKKLMEANKDRDSLQYKIKTLSSERTRLQGICDARAQETLAAKKEGDKWKEEVKQMENKLSAANSKLKIEADAHRESKDSLDKTLAQLAEMQSNLDKAKAETRDVLDKQRQEEQKEKQKVKEAEVKLMIDSVTAAELETLRKKHKQLLEENNELSQKVQGGERERLAYESSLSELKETAAKQKAEIVDLYAKCAELESLRLRLQGETDKCEAKDAEVIRLRAEAQELQGDMTSCRKKEAELLDFTQKLMDKNVTLQSEFSSIEQKANCLEEQNKRLEKSLETMGSRLADLQSQMEAEMQARLDETKKLKEELEEQSKQAAKDAQFASDARNEVEVLKRQNNARTRELTKELNTLKRKVSGLEPDGNLSPGSRASSNSSLNKHEHNSQDVSPESLKGASPIGGQPAILLTSPSHLHPAATITGNSEVHHVATRGAVINPENNNTLLHVNGGGLRKVSHPEPLMPISEFGGTMVGMPDTQVLVEKIVKLQRSCARRQEKLDFLEEHVEQLLGEVQKKNKIIQCYVLSLEPGALASEQSDIHKAVMGSHSGIMSSVYNSKVADSGMTLDLSLEINKKLQAVLEDTLLKNITLKENINTLGGEIAKLAVQQASNR